MYKYTTPTHIFEFPEDPSLYSEIEVTYSQNGKIILVKNKDEMIFEYDSDHYYGTINLTQEETAKFNSNWKASIQIRVLTNIGKCYASEEFQVCVKPVLNERVLGEF